ncbi:MAG TPA: CBS domain-containing protein [Anaerolineaceae bacterium]|jgi:CBS domain-containing protein
MTTVRQIIQAKGMTVWTISPQASVLEALQLMAEKNVGALLVTEGEQVAGIFSERDYARSVALRGRTAENTQIGEIMTPRVIYVHPSQSMEDCMALMTDKHIRHLPVMEGERLIGVISIGDVVKEIISEQQFTIHSLESYITGSK